MEQLLGDSRKAFEKLGWQAKTSLEELIEEMILDDKKSALKESLLLKEGFEINNYFESPPSNIEKK